MKTLKILVLVSILAVSQSLASSNTQRNIFLGIGAGALVAYALESSEHTNYVQTKIVHVGPDIKPKRYTSRHIKRHHRAKRHHARQHRYNKHQRYNSYAFNNSRSCRY